MPLMTISIGSHFAVIESRFRSESVMGTSHATIVRRESERARALPLR